MSVRGVYRCKDALLAECGCKSGGSQSGRTKKDRSGNDCGCSGKTTTKKPPCPSQEHNQRSTGRKAKDGNGRHGGYDCGCDGKPAESSRKSKDCGCNGKPSLAESSRKSNDEKRRGASDCGCDGKSEASSVITLKSDGYGLGGASVCSDCQCDSKPETSNRTSKGDGHRRAGNCRCNNATSAESVPSSRTLCSDCGTKHSELTDSLFKSDWHSMPSSGSLRSRHRRDRDCEPCPRSAPPCHDHGDADDSDHMMKCLRRRNDESIESYLIRSILMLGNLVNSVAGREAGKVLVTQAICETMASIGRSKSVNNPSRAMGAAMTEEERPSCQRQVSSEPEPEPQPCTHCSHKDNNRGGTQRPPTAESLMRAERNRFISTMGNRYTGHNRSDRDTHQRYSGGGYSGYLQRGTSWPAPWSTLSNSNLFNTMPQTHSGTTDSYRSPRYYRHEYVQLVVDICYVDLPLSLIYHCSVWSVTTAHTIIQLTCDHSNVVRVCVQHPFSGGTLRQSRS